MKIIDTIFSDILILQPEFQSENSTDMVVYSSKEFDKFGINAKFVQQNLIFSNSNVLRGLHFQINKPQGKLIRVISGSVFDVVVDMRKNSVNFGKSACFDLSDINNYLVWIPPGYAHGFYVLSDSANFSYSITEYRHSEYERTLLWNDPYLDINWPLDKLIPPILSINDQNGVSFKNCESI